MSLAPSDRESDMQARDHEQAIRDEQDYVSMLYRTLDAEREFSQRRLNEALGRKASTPQERQDRNVEATTQSDRLGQLNTVEQGLCFGRLDYGDGSASHIGRIGLFDSENDYEPLLLDWRAPASRPFYLATAASPDGVRMRRHLRTFSRSVVDVNDETLDLDAAGADDGLGLAGEAALLAALEQRRTGEMGDIVSTIQAEQDRIIRADLNGVTVVQGGPGTGKTAVALHRAAYLLYTYRQQLSTRGVLVIGPNDEFLRYIGQVLPSLGESGVLLTTIGGLFPGATVGEADEPAAAEVKGRLDMASVLAQAVTDRQQIPDEPFELEVDGEPLWLYPSDCSAARDKAQRSRKPHNLARRVFIADMLERLTKQAVQRTEDDASAGVPEIPLNDDESDPGDLLDAHDFSTMRSELADSLLVQQALDSLWPKLTPQQALAELFASAERVDDAAAAHLGGHERALLRRGPDAAWTPQDVPLLDELAELLGVDDTDEQAEQARQEREERAYAEGVLHVLEQDEEIVDEEVLRVADVLDAELLAERQEYRSQLTAAQRAVGDRNWTFGHVIVDEAQELSAMDWRLLMRRCPSRSMTVVGDVAQTGAAGGASSWQQVLGPYVADRWRLRELSVNYRTPTEVMDLAGGVLEAADPTLRQPTSVRATGTVPWRRQVGERTLGAQLAETVTAELSAADGGTVAVLCPAERVAQLRDALAGVPDQDRLSILPVHRAKGLEFDAVVLVCPDEIVAGSARGWRDLYVAATRPTQRLGIVHTAAVSPDDPWRVAEPG